MAYDVEFQPATKRARASMCPKDRSGVRAILHGSEGGSAGWSSWLALALAMKGPHPYSKGGNGWHAGDIHDVDLDETVTAIRWLREQPAVSGKVGLYGASSGAEHAILLTSLLTRDGLADHPNAVAVHSPIRHDRGGIYRGGR